MDVAMRWVTMAAVVGGAAWYYGWLDKIISRSSQIPQATRNETAERTTKRRKPRNNIVGHVVSSTDSGSASDQKEIRDAAEDRVQASISDKDRMLARSEHNDSEVTGAKENRDFANALKRTQQGTKFSSAGKQNGARSKARTIKQKFANEDSAHASAEASSTAGTSSAGQDGDDENTPAASPVTNATTSEIVLDTTGVGDMLPAAHEGPKTLKLTGDWQHVQAKQTPAAKVPEPTETKKQRQARRKREEEKERIAQSNKEHEAKRQQQMRTARMAEGTSKQAKANAFHGPSNIWAATSTGSKASDVKQPADDATSSAPLDTFEPTPAGDGSSYGAVTAQPTSQVANGQSVPDVMEEEKKEPSPPAANILAAPERQKAFAAPLHRTQSWADEMDEEEQIRLVQQDSHEWESVTTKKDKRKVRRADVVPNDVLTARVNGQAYQSAANNKTKSIPSRQQGKPQAENRFGSLLSEPTSNEAQEEVWEA